MIVIGLDDTDVEGSPGTNQAARRIASALPRGFELVAVLRHQLLLDPRIPYTSGNGAASVLVRGEPGGAGVLVSLVRAKLAKTPAGSDPGFCVGVSVPADVTAFGRRCQREVVLQGEAHALAARHGLHLEGLGGARIGVIGALAAVGLAASGEDGRVVHLPRWPWPDDLSGVQSLDTLRARGVHEVREHGTDARVTQGRVDLGKRLRPAYRDGKVVLYVERAAAGAPGAVEDGLPRWRALKLP